MKKHLIAAAVAAAFVTPAVAQVTVSGAIDIQAQNNQKRSVVNGNDGFSTSTTASNDRKLTGTGGSTGTAVGGWSDSQVVFTANEDLGGGLKATGVFTQRLTNDGNWGGNRDKFLDLAGGFGSVRIGRFVPAVSNFGGYGNNGTTNTAGHSLGFFNGATGDTGAEFFTGATSTGDYHRQNGVLQYTTPTFSGFVSTVGVVRTSDDLSSQPGKAKIEQNGITVNYSAGKLAVGVGFAERKTEREQTSTVAAETTGATRTLGSQSVTNATAKSDVTWVGARYDVGGVILSAAYGERKDEGGNVGSAQATLIDSNIASIAVTVPLGAITLMGSMYDGEDKRTSATTDDATIKGHQVSAHYALSKRTVAYIVNGQNKLTAETGSDSRKTTETTIGLRHSF